MAISEYRDFVLVADDVEKNEKGIAVKFTVSVFDSPVGQGEKEEEVEVSESLPREMRWLEERRLDKDVDRQIELGEILAGLLLPSYARRMFSESLARLRNGEGLRLRLRLADELADFPWEYMYIQDTRGERTPSSFLALDPRISIVRHEAIKVPCDRWRDWFTAPSKRRVIVAMATPQPHKDYRKLKNLPKEQNLIKEAFSEITGVEAIYLPEYANDLGGEIPGATLKDLTTALMERTDVFHFAGHGEFAEKMGPAFGSRIGEGAIVLADAENYANPVSADRLTEVLRSKGVRLVVLGACETGRRDGHNVWSSVVASVMKAGIPAVVAMQFTINDKLAAEFAGALYKALIAGFTIDEAVAMGRAAIRRESQNGQRDIRDWGVPVLYLRTPGGRVFNPVSDEQAREKAARESDMLIEQHIREVSSTGRVIGLVAKNMVTGTADIEQKVKENVKGVMIGADVYNIQGGRLIVDQKVDTVTGDMTGVKVGTIGGKVDDLGRTPSEQDLELGEKQVTEGLERYMRLEPSKPDKGTKPAGTGSTCPNCREPVEAGQKFCPDCGTDLRVGPGTCVKCGTELPAGTKFCSECGAKVE